MDHTHVFADSAELTGRLHHLSLVQDAAIYGAFPAFVDLWNEQLTVETLGRLSTCEVPHIAPFVDQIPAEWQVDEAARAALKQFIVDRAHWLSAREPALFRPQAQEQEKEG